MILADSRALELRVRKVISREKEIGPTQESQMAALSALEQKKSPIYQLSCVLAATLLTLPWIESLHCEPITIIPEQTAFAYPAVKPPERGAAWVQSLSSILKESAPPYISSPAKNLRRAAAGAAWQHNLPITFFVNLIQQESS